MSELESPDVFRAEPTRGAGVRRLNRRPLAVVFLLGALVLGVVFYTVMERADQNLVTRRSEQKAPEAANADGVLGNAPSAGLIEAKVPPPPPAKPRIAVTPSGVPVAVGEEGRPADVDLYAQEWQQYRQQQQQLVQARTQAAQAALTASPAVSDVSGTNPAAQARSGVGMPQPPVAPQGLADELRDTARSAMAGMQEGDPNRGAEKREWLESEPKASDYLSSTRTAPISAQEIKTGTVIPGVMISGINSDLPGQIIAQVREHVYDTATGHHVLIPQGARLIGTYDNQVTRGQARVLVAWTRIVFPDASTLDLENMPGADQGGFAGFKDKVNNHFFRVFGDAMMLSLFSAGLQLSQPQSQVGQGYDNQQIIAASIGQQLGQAGMQVVQRNLAIQPTLEIRPGLRFNVMVTKDVVLPAWESAR